MWAYSTTAVLVISLFGYYFIMHTNRGSSLALYAIGGWHAPLGVKIACGKDTDVRVYNKFLLPLAFDEDTKDQLRGFWFYSYYRDCLFAHGFDFKGNPVPHSTIVGDGSSYRFTNEYAGFSFVVPSSTVLATDNNLDVDYDSDLFHTILTTADGLIVADTYVAHDLFKTPGDIPLHYREEPMSRTTILEANTISTPTHLDVFSVREADGTTRLIFMTPLGYVVDIHGTPLPDEVRATILNSLNTD
ncbi:MAG: hypothetical protein RLZZ234_607 [Candidatus Parcubacteria bacterium]